LGPIPHDLSDQGPLSGHPEIRRFHPDRGSLCGHRRPADRAQERGRRQCRSRAWVQRVRTECIMSLSITPRRMMIYGAIGAAALAWRLSGQSSDDTGTAVIRHAGASSGPRGGASTLSSNAAAFLTRLAHRTSNSTTADALFATHSWYVAPPPPPPPPPAAPVVAPPPTAPPLPFTLLGSYAAQGDQVTYFLARGDRIYN